jgi:phthiocerol/phenolphthiocerol synthesis type-I polyketide synthase E
MTGSTDWPPGSEAGPAADPIAIIGLACRFPGATSAGAFWRNLADGVESTVLDEAESIDTELFGFSVREAGLLDVRQRVFLELAYTALEDGAYDPFRHDGDIGVFAGVAAADRSDCVCVVTSRQLRLRGPSLTVHVGGSTSLVALHLAAAALRAGECDMALSGGVDIAPPAAGVRAAVPGRAYSPDGHCRAFDAKADGTFPGSGGAVVLLKRLSDALADGDHIRAVLLGDAVSHDGQATVIARALAAAGVDARTIGYVEADGSGTLLGDYAEVGTLSSVFRQYSGDAGWCAIGAVTTNIGHLGAAAGMAGLAKTVLALERGFIPASLNYETANPRIDFGANPFVVSTALTRWEPGEVPRRASVSSLGAAGTNAHVILEEPPRQARRRRGDARPSHLLLLSARTPTALDTAARRLSEHLAGLPDAEDAGAALADVAYTLRVGRPWYQQRLAVTATSPADAAAALVRAARVITGTPAAKSPEVILMFPGEGEGTRPGMAAQLYHGEPVVREAIDECAEAVREHVGADIREVMLRADAGDCAGAEELSRRPAIARSALFCFEYALALFWRDLGVTPVGMVGHGIGEYVAATLAETCALSDAIAALCADDVPRPRFRPGVTGDWVPGSAAAGPACWTRQGQVTVRSPDYLAAVLRAADPVLLECGPGEQLSALARSHLNGRYVAVVPSLPRRGDGKPDLGALYSAVGRLWASGVQLDLASFGSHGRRVPLPSYPWERTYVPAAPGAGTGDAVSDVTPDTARQATAGDEAASDYAVPRDELEATVARVWADVLGTERIGVTDDFFDLGGNSLIAARMTSMLRDQTGVRLPARSFFADPTVAGVAAALAGLLEPGDPPC